MQHKEEIWLEGIEPDYMEEFVCTGTFCPDTCCQGWEIVIDEQTCERYRKVHDPEFKEMLSRAIVHRQEETETGLQEVACIRMGKGKRCLFLCNDGLCMIQRQTEEVNLSETCRTYPRVIYIWNEVYVERSLCVSCPEVARLVLSRQKPLQLLTKKIAVAELEGLRITDKGQRLHSHCLPLRRLLIRILQDRNQALPVRLRQANDFFWQAGAVSGHHGEKRFLQLAAEYEAQLLDDPGPEATEAGEFTDDLARRQLTAIGRLLFQRRQNPGLRAVFRENLDRAIERWQLAADGIPSERGLLQYKEDRELYQLFFLPEYAPMWENYLVNEVFKNIFITEEKEEFYRQWVYLLLQFFIGRAQVMAALAAAPGDLPEATVIEIVRLNAREVGHDSMYLQQGLELFAVNAAEEESLQEFCHLLLL